MEKKELKKIFVTGILALSLLVTSISASTNVNAETNEETESQQNELKVRNVHQTGATYSSVSLSWQAYTPKANDESGEKGSETLSSNDFWYEVHISEIEEQTVSGSAVSSEEAKEWKLKISTYETSATLYNLDAGTDYFVRVIAKKKSIPRTVVTTYFDKLKVSTIPSKANVPDIVDLSSDSVSLSWSAVKGANKYKVIGYADGDNKRNDYGVTSNTKMTISNLKSTTTYNFVVYSLHDTGTYESINDSEYNMVQATTLPTQINNLTIRDEWDEKKAQTLFWDSVNVEGYEIAISTNGSSDIKTYDVVTPTFDVTEFATSAWQSAKVRGYITVNNTKKYSSFSDTVFFAKEAKATSVKQIKKKKKLKAQAKVKWSKVTGSNSYTVFLSRKPTKGYVKIATTKKKNFTLKKYKGSKLKFGKNYYVKIVANKTVNKTTYTSFNTYEFKKFKLKANKKKK